MSADSAIIIFAKFPEEGKVKTRLAKDKGPYFATEFYRVCAEHIISEVKKLNNNNFTSYVYCYSNSQIEMISRWLGKELIVRSQIDGDLGERMSNSFNEVFQAGFLKAIIIGTDVPDINSDLINSAASKLDENDLVIGPSLDGGYYLLGMNRLVSEIFRDIQWSTSLVLQSTLNKIKSLELKAGLLEELIDIDTENDLLNWMKTCNDENNPIYKFVSEYHKQFKEN